MWIVESIYPKVEPGDGQTARVDVDRTPARFYRVVAHASENGIGERVRGFVLSTGSGGDEMRRLAHAIAKAASEGMIAYTGETLP